MSSSSWIVVFFTSLAQQAPFLLVGLIGAVIALMRWQRHPFVSMMYMLAYGLFMISAVVGAFVTSWLPYYLQQTQGDMMRLSSAYAILGVFRGLIAAVAWACLLCAVFGNREYFARQG